MMRSLTILALFWVVSGSFMDKWDPVKDLEKDLDKDVCNEVTKKCNEDRGSRECRDLCEHFKSECSTICDKPKPKCKSLEVLCPSPDFRLDDTQCRGLAVSSCSVADCCEPRAGCDSMQGACQSSDYNIGSGHNGDVMQGLCPTTVDTCEASLCCKPKATCGTFAGTCPFTQFKLGTAELCPRDAESCSFNGCCSPKASCAHTFDGSQCPEGKFLIQSFDVGGDLCPADAETCTEDVCCTAKGEINFKKSACKDCCDDQMVFDIRMCTSFMCTKCDQDYCRKKCQDIQTDFPTCRCAAWPKSRATFASGEYAGKGKYGDAGDYA